MRRWCSHRVVRGAFLCTGLCAIKLPKCESVWHMHLIVDAMCGHGIDPILTYSQRTGFCSLPAQLLSCECQGHVAEQDGVLEVYTDP
jgi:hypothetical protein